jgi:nitroreductase
VLTKIPVRGKIKKKVSVRVRSICRTITEKQWNGGITMSETLKVLETRRSCRAYKPELIEEEKLQKIIKAGTYAATGMGKQSPIIIAVTNKELRDRLSAMNAKVMGQPAGFDPFYGAPELLIVLANKSVPTYLYDGSLVMGNLMNAAEDLGVNSCWIHRAKEEFESEEGKEILKELGITGDYEGIGHLVLGYAAAPPKEAAARKEDYVYYIR